jgi:hypothetical protein
MITHVAIFAWTQPPTSAQLQALLAAAHELPRQVPGLLRIDTGVPLDRRDGLGDIALVAEVEDGAFDDYLRHPAHRQFQERHTAGRVRVLGSVQFASGAGVCTAPTGEGVRRA